MDQKIIDLYDSFTHGGINRRQFLDRLAEIAGSSAAALALLPLLQNDYARAAVIAPDDARLAIDSVAYDAAGTRISGYLARLKSKANARRSSSSTRTAGSIRISRISRGASRSKASSALAPDMLSPLGGTPADEDTARDMIGTLNPDETAHRIAAAVPFPGGARGIDRQCRHRRLLLGGGGMVNRIAVRWRPA